MSTKHDDITVFTKAVTFQGPVTFSEDPPDFSLDGVVDLTTSGDLTVGDDASVLGDLAVAGSAALHATTCTTLAASGATTLAAATASGTVTTNGTLDVNGPLDLAGATITLPSGYRLAQYLEVAFVVADIQGGAKASAGLPTNALILGVHIQITTALVFSAVDTTEVTAKIGNSVDDDGYGTAIALAGSTGYRRPAPGALTGGVVAGESGGLVCTFTASAGGSPDLADVSAGAGKIVVHYITV